MKIIKKFIAAFIILTLLIQVSPLSFITYANNNTLDSVVQICYEIIEKRDAYTKVYRLSDGSYMSIISVDPVHYYDSLSGWVEYSGNLSNPNPSTEEEILENISELSSFAPQSALSNISSRKISANVITNDNLTEEVSVLPAFGGTDVLFNGLSEDSFSELLIEPAVLQDEEKIIVPIKSKLFMKGSAEDYEDAPYIFASVVTNELSNNPEYYYEPSTEPDEFDATEITETNTFYELDITKKYIRWKNGYDNYGMLLCIWSECVASFESCAIVTYYREIDEYEGLFGYSTNVDMGRAGQLYVKDYVNSTLLSREEISIDGAIMPVSIARSFDGSVHDTANPYGMGGRINYSSKLEYLLSSYRWYDMDGNIHDFTLTEPVQTDGNGRTKYVIKGGQDLSYTLWLSSIAVNNYDYANVIIEDETGFKYQFNSTGMLISITDNSTNENSIHITYNGNAISQITDGVGRKYIFTYTTQANGISVLTKISAKTADNATITVTNSAGQTIALEMNYTYAVVSPSSCVLTMVSYPDGESVSYEYDTNGRLILLTDIDNTKLELSYSTGSGSTYQDHDRHLTNFNMYKYDASNVAVSYEDVDFISPSIYKRSIRNNLLNTTKSIYYDTKYNVISEELSNNVKIFSSYDENNKIVSKVYEKDNYTNLIINGDFETQGSSIHNSYGWKNTRNNTEASRSYHGYHSNYEYWSNGWEDSIYQKIPVSAQAGDCFAFGAYSRGFTNCKDDNSFASLTVMDADANGAPRNIVGEIMFDSNEDDWIKRMSAIKLTENTEYLYIYLQTFFQHNIIHFDDIELYESDIIFFYENAVVPNGEAFCVCGEDCQYGEGCPCTCESETTCNCVCCHATTTTTENSNGNILTNVISDGTQSMTSTYSYSQTGNYVSQTVDSNGSNMYYEYNENNGLLDSVAVGDADESIEYHYSAMGLLEEITQAISGLSGNATEMSTLYNYTHGQLTSITHNGFTYGFEYDAYGNTTAVLIEEQPLVEYTYDENSHQIGSATFGNGDVIHYNCNADGNITSIRYNNDATPTYVYTYNSYGKLIGCMDHSSGVYTSYTDNSYNMRLGSPNGPSIYSSTTDSDGETTEIFNGESYISSNAESYDEITGKNTVTNTIETPSGTINNTVVSDYFGRIESKNFVQEDDNDEEVINVDVDYNYADTATTASGLVISYSHEVTNVSNDTTYSKRYQYVYDNKGNISQIKNYYGQLLCSYQYDEANQLIRENNAQMNKSYVYTYDTGGNISSKSEYPFSTETLGTATDTVVYTYDSVWKDKLISYDGNNITYDAIGNPLTYKGNSYDWNGRQLMSITDSDGGKTCYTYDDNGYRTNKIIYNTANEQIGHCRYTWDNGVMTSQTLYSDDGNNDIFIKFIYDSQGEILGFNCQVESSNVGTVWYQKNLQGDVIGLVTPENGQVLYYKYDAWGNMSWAPSDNTLNGIVSAIFLALLNPITYRGYYYDGDSAMYYLQSRCYMSDWGRFLNADAYCDTETGVVGTNMFAYCDNNAVNCVDYSGMVYEFINSNDTNYIAKRAYYMFINSNLSSMVTSSAFARIDGRTRVVKYISYTWKYYTIYTNGKIVLDMRKQNTQKVLVTLGIRSEKQWKAYILLKHKSYLLEIQNRILARLGINNNTFENILDTLSSVDNMYISISANFYSFITSILNELQNKKDSEDRYILQSIEEAKKNKRKTNNNYNSDMKILILLQADKYVYKRTYMQSGIVMRSYMIWSHTGTKYAY